VSRRRNPTPPSREPEPPRKPLPEDMARDAIAHEEPAPGPRDRVRLTFRIAMDRKAAEALAARAIREEKNIGTLVNEILEAAARKAEP
jgi:hypothetical protein